MDDLTEKVLPVTNRTVFSVINIYGSSGTNTELNFQQGPFQTLPKSRGWDTSVVEKHWYLKAIYLTK